MTTGQQLDPILQIRLDVLEQASDEVDDIIQAMQVQRHMLDGVNEYLRPDGPLNEVEQKIETALADALTRVNGVSQSAGAALSEYNGTRMAQAHGFMTDALDLLAELSRHRSIACEQFEDVRRWSVAGLTEGTLEESAEDYRKLITEIRRSDDPWRRYREELRGGGEDLFTRYLELLSGMAVRGFGLDAEIMADVRELVRQLVVPLGRRGADQLGVRSPLAMLGSRHIPLGYPVWSLWALPLVGRTAGEQVIEKGNFETKMDERQRALCADAYALFVLGPSYLHAAIFLELDPGSSADVTRAKLLLDRLPGLAPEFEEDHPRRRELADIANTLRQPWEHAVEACGCAAPAPPGDDLEVVEEFVAELRRDYREIVYDTRLTAKARKTVEKLLDPTAPLTGSAPAMHEVVTAIWLARLAAPNDAAAIHERARTIAQQKPTQPPDRKILQRIGGGG